MLIFIADSLFFYLQSSIRADLVLRVWILEANSDDGSFDVISIDINCAIRIFSSRHSYYYRTLLGSCSDKSVCSFIVVGVLECTPV